MKNGINLLIKVYNHVAVYKLLVIFKIYLQLILINQQKQNINHIGWIK